MSTFTNTHRLSRMRGYLELHPLLDGPPPQTRITGPMRLVHWADHNPEEEITIKGPECVSVRRSPKCRDEALTSIVNTGPYPLLVVVWLESDEEAPTREYTVAFGESASQALGSSLIRIYNKRP